MENRNVQFLPYALPDIGEEEILAVTNAMRSGWVTSGPRVKHFEEEFGRYLGGGLDCIAVNSATSGLHLALEGLGIGHGDEIITTVLTFTATAEVARYLGADVVFVDVDPHTLNLDPRAVCRAITKRTKAILPVHYGGLACDMTSILQIAREHDLKVVEDAAHALPTSIGGTLVGRLDTDATVFSFYANKTMTTGEGGMVVTRHVEMANRMRLMRLHGISRDAFDRFVSKEPAWYYEILAAGFKYNMTDMAAAMGVEQLAKLPSFARRRQDMAARYCRELADTPLKTPAHALPGDTHAWHLYVVRLLPEARITRDELITALAERGIGTSVHYVPLHRQPYWRDRYSLKPESFPITEAAYKSMVSLPLYTKMTDDDQARVITAVRDILL